MPLHVNYSTYLLRVTSIEGRRLFYLCLHLYSRSYGGILIKFSEGVAQGAIDQTFLAIPIMIQIHNFLKESSFTIDIHTDSQE